MRKRLAPKNISAAYPIAATAAPIPMATCFPVEEVVVPVFWVPMLSRDPSVAPCEFVLALSWEFGVPEAPPGEFAVVDPSAINGIVGSMSLTSCSAVGSTCEYNRELTANIDTRKVSY